MATRRTVRAFLPATETLYTSALARLPPGTRAMFAQLQENLKRYLPVRVAERESRRPLAPTPSPPAPLRPRPPQPLVAPSNQDTQPFNGTLTWKLKYQVSDSQLEKSGTIRYTGPVSGIRPEIDNVISAYLGGFSQPAQILSVDTEVQNLSKTRTFPFDYQQNRMLSSDPLDISVNLFSNTISIRPTEENCVKTFLRTQYPNISSLKKDPIGHLGTNEGVSTEELIKFCEHYKIRMIAWNIKREVIAHTNPSTTHKKYASLYFISYNNHMYPVKNHYLEQRPKGNKTTHLSPDGLYEKFEELLDSGVLPADICVDDGQLISYKHEEVEYFANSQYNDCYKVLQQFGIHANIRPNTRYTNVLYELEKAYNGKALASFFPIQHVKPAFYYNKADIDSTRTVDTLDKNKAYSYILQNLPHLLSVDYRTTPIEDAPFKLTKNALYIATPDIPCILMPKQDIYCGDHLLYCKGKINFTVQEKLSATSHPNIYTNIIKDLYELCDPDVVKKIVVRTIGTFECEVSVKESVRAYVVNDQEMNPSNAVIQVGSHQLELQPTTYISSLTNRKPIAIQVKDQMNVLLYEKMVELNLTHNDIVQINTDSITFYAKPSVRLLSTTAFDGWKVASYRPKQGSLFDSATPFITMRQKRPNENTLTTGNAGNGKSYDIQNTLDLKDSIILSTKHSAISQHRDKGLNAQVVQCYTYRNTLPAEHHIIVEEIGIWDSEQWFLLIKCFLLGKKITAFGDFQQLLPVSETAPFSSPQFLDMMFATQRRKDTNYRNDFTPEYYNSLITSTDSNFLASEIRRHSTKTPEEADVIIAYRNVVVDTYNQHMLNYHKKTINDPDVPMVCKTNDLKEKNIFNGFVMMSQDISPEDQIHFKLAYARTLYNMQGDQTRSYYMAPEDIHWFSKPREAYTLISRLHTKV